MSVIPIGIRRTRRRRRRGKANHFCVCPHKNAKAAASVFATDDHCSNNDKSELRQKCVRVCVLMRSPNNLLSSFSLCMHFFSSSTKILLFFSLSLIFHLHLQQRRIKIDSEKKRKQATPRIAPLVHYHGITIRITAMESPNKP